MNDYVPIDLYRCIFVLLDHHLLSRWRFQIYFFCFHPYLGKVPILTNIFQMG